MASDPIGNLVGACVGYAKSASAAASEVGNAVVNAGADLVNRKTEDLDDIRKAAKSGNLGAVYLETMEAFSAGESVKDSLGALGLLPDDNKLVGEMVSGLVNYVSGNPIAAAKDAFDIFSELSKAPARPGAPGLPGLTVPTPSKDIKQFPAAPTHYPNLPNLKPRQPQSALDAIMAMQKAIMEELKKLVGSGQSLAPSSGTTPPVARHAPEDMHVELPDNLRGEIDKHPGRTGGPVIGRPIDEVSFEEIFADKSLAFEDLIFLFMLKMNSELKNQMKEKMEEAAAAGEAGEAGKQGGAAKAGSAAGSGSAGGGGSITDVFTKGLPALGDLFSNPETLKGLATGALDIAKVAAPVVLPLLGAAIGTVAPGVGNFIGGLAGGVGGMALSVGMDLLKGAIEGGAFDGLLEGAMGMAQGGGAEGAARPGAKGGATTGGAAKGGKGAEGGDGADGAKKKDRDLIMAELQQLQNKMSEFQQAMSNVLKAQHDTAMNAIGNLR